MASVSAVRIIMKKSSLETFKKASDEISELIEDADVNKTYGILLYLGWDSICSGDLDILSDGITELRCEDLTYRFTIVGEQYNDIDERYFTAPEDEDLWIPFPSMNRTFDEKELEKEMQYFVNDAEKNQTEKEDIDI